MTAEDDADADRRIQAVAAEQPPFARLMGIKIVEVTRDKVVAEVVVRDELTNRNGGLHGGAVMGIADNLGGTATFVNMPSGAGTTTIESKTNFFAAVPAGDTIRAECTRCTAGGQRWCGRPASSAATAGSRPSSPRRSSSPRRAAARSGTLPAPTPIQPPNFHVLI
jgi:1,4-dihydroxy-2-naphthoyl-CoA hydrolase